MAALSITDFPLEHWNRHLITHSSAPYANPHSIDPVCLTGIDFSAVLVTVKAETITDIPLHLTVKNHCSNGSLAKVSIVAFDDLAPSSHDSNGPDVDPIPEAFSSGDEQEYVELQGGETYADVLQLMGAPMPLVPHGAPSSAAPAASPVARALANAPPLPSVLGGPVLSKPKLVKVKLRLGFFDVLVEGTDGEWAFFRLPLRRAAEDLGCKGLMVANFATASVGLVDCIARVGPQCLPSLVVDILARGSPPDSTFQVPLEAAIDLVLAPAGSSSAVVPAASLAGAPSASASPASPLRDPALSIDLAPVRDTVWRAPSPVLEPRRSSRLISVAPKNFISIIDKAIMRKKGLNEGTSEPPKRHGELCADELLAVAVEDGRPLLPGDAQDLARACDIPEAALGLPAVLSASDP
jgi:hypothetical protein